MKEEWLNEFPADFKKYEIASDMFSLENCLAKVWQGQSDHWIKKSVALKYS